MSKVFSKDRLFYLIPALLVFTLTYLFSFRSAIVIDFGVLIDRSYRIFMGEVPYRDFNGPTTPLTFFMQAMMYKLFAPKVFWMKIYLSVMNTVLVLIAIFFNKRILKFDPRIVAFIVIPVTIVWSPGIILMRPWYDFDANFYAFSSLCLLALGATSGKRWIFFIAGIASCLSVLSKQNIGGGSTLCAILFILLQPAETSEKMKRLLIYGLGASIPAILFISYLAYHKALQHGYEWIVVRAASKAGTNYIDQAAGVILRPDNNFIKLVFILYISGIILCWKERKEEPAEGTLKLGIVLYGFLTVWAGCLAERGNDYGQQQIYLGTLCGILGSGVIRKVKMEPVGIWIKKPAFIALLLAAGLSMIWPVRINWRIPFKFKTMVWTPDNERMKGMYFQYTDYRFVQDLFDFEKKIPKEERIFLFPDPMFFYFATGRMSPTPQAGFHMPGWEDPEEIVNRTGEYLTEKNVVWAFIGQEYYTDHAYLRFGLNETWDSAVKKNMAMTSRGDYSQVRDFLHKNYYEVPGPAGYWILKRKKSAKL